MERRSEFIENKMGWLRSLNLGESKTGYVSTPKECYSMSVLIAKLNAMEAKERGFKIRGHYDAEKCMITIYTEKYEAKTDSVLC